MSSLLLLLTPKGNNGAIFRIPGLANFFEAGVGVTTSAGDVTRWADLVGANHVIPQNASFLPNLATTPWGARAVNFDGSRPERLKLTNAVNMVGKTIIWASDSPNTGGMAIFSAGDATRYIQYLGSANEGVFFMDGSDPQIGKPQSPAAGKDRRPQAIGTMQVASALNRMGFDGALGTGAAHAATTANLLQIGAIGTGTSAAFTGRLYGFAIFNRADLTATELNTIYQYFASRYYKNTFTVKASGGDYTGITTALNDIYLSQRHTWSPAVLNVEANTYTENAIPQKIGTSIVGAGSSVSGTVIVGALADGTDPTTISTTSTVDFDFPGTLSGVRASAQNERYVVHMEAGGVGYTTQDVYNISDCYLAHLGNPSPNNTWLNQAAIGAGSGNGAHYNILNNTLVSPYLAFGIHDNLNYTLANAINFSGNMIDVASSLEHIRFTSVGSGIYNHQVTLQDNTSVGDVPIPMFWGREYQGVTDPALMYWRQFPYNVTIINCPLVYPLADVSDVCSFPSFSRVLSITANAADSIISVSGTAVDVLMKNANFPTLLTVAGGGGLAPKIHGVLNVSEETTGYPTPATGTQSIGQRLGDCSSVNKTLTVTVNGTPATMTFNADYTAQSNATILAAINAAISTVASVIAHRLNSEVFRFWSSDRDLTITNTGLVGFELYSAVVNVGGAYRLAKSTDLTIDGICIDRIVPGASGRILTKGYLRQEHTVFTGADIGAASMVGVDPGQDGRLTVIASGNQIGTGYSPKTFGFNIPVNPIDVALQFDNPYNSQYIPLVF